MIIGVITGSGFYDFPELKESSESDIDTEFGAVTLNESKLKDHSVYSIARHGRGHAKLPNMINFRGNIAALKSLGAELIISTSVMGVLDPDIPLSALLLFDDLYFPDNRLPSGEICSIFTKPADKERGHYMFQSPFSAAAKGIALGVAEKEGVPFRDGLVYAHVNGPRFNSRTEITALRSIGCSAISQTAGPEIVLAGECDIAFLLLGFGVDYANGVTEIPTPLELLNKNLKRSKDTLTRVITGIIGYLPLEGKNKFFDSGFVYRFR